ncbi:hypothetical protein, partial [Rhodoferax sp.]|uniref:hypothetical protein n=1 Tax=Rhodoferax sp. TaxID=50421 RepID=UPI0025D9FA84
MKSGSHGLSRYARNDSQRPVIARNAAPWQSMPGFVIAYMDAPFEQALNTVMQKSERLQPYIRTLMGFLPCLVPDGMCGLAPLA